MRIHRLELTGIGPFRTRQDLDFDALTTSGLFLVDGPTGAGKSTLIDAIVFALYGGVSGTQSDTARLRSDHAAPEEHSEVRLEFSVHGRRHRITRNPAYQRPSKRGGGTTMEKAAQVLVELGPEGQEVTTLTSAEEIGRHIRDLMGMSADQFRQLVVLPQGEFDALLRMKPVERLDALANLLGNEFYERIQADLVSQAAALRAALANARDEVSSVASQIRGAVLTGSLEVDPELALVDSDEAQEIRCSAVTDIIVKVRAAGAAATELADQVQQNTDALREQQDLLQQSLDHSERQMQARKNVLDCASRLEEVDRALVGSKAQLAQSRSGDLRHWNGALADAEDWERESDQREDQRSSLLAAVSTCSSTLAAVEEEARQLPALHNQAARSVEELLAAVQESASLGDERTALAAVLQQVADLEAARAEWQQAATVALEAAERVAHAQTEVDSAQAHLQRLQAQQVEQAALLLARGLEDGQACPVCGSCEHPAKAKAHAAEGVVTDKALQSAQFAVTKAQAALRKEQSAAAEAATDEQRCRSARDKCEGAVGSADAVAASTRVAEIDRRREDIATAQEDLDRARRALAEVDEKIESLDRTLADARDREAVAKKELDVHDAVVEKRQAAVDKVMRAAHLAVGTEPTSITSPAQLRELLDSRAEALDHYARALADDEAVYQSAQQHDASAQQAEGGANPVAMKEQLAMLAQAILELNEQHSGHISVAGNCARLADSLEILGAAFDAALSSLEECQRSAQPVLAMADVVSAARGSANVRRLTLASFAIQQRFAAVLEAASIHLDRMSGGKYELVLEEAAKGNQQAGLGIAVIDGWTGQRRDPRTLSGGETFYVSLALALGLADVVRDEAGGIPIETLFVDEGFGSLDQETLNQVLDQLDHLRGAGRVVGVISHVTEMKEWVSDRIEVVVGSDRTSTARVVSGGSLG